VYIKFMASTDAQPSFTQTEQTSKHPFSQLPQYQEYHFLHTITSTTMYSTLAILSTLFAATYAGNICAAGEFKATGTIDSNNLMMFAAGSPCDEGRTVTLPPGVDRNMCDSLPLEFTICDKTATLVKMDHGPVAHPGCQIGLSIDSVEYEGETWPFNPSDGNASQGGPCDATCGLTGVDGFLHFIGVPMCD
jgi:hypothetical protein